MVKRIAMIALLLASAMGIAAAGPVNVNTADAETIARELSGIGVARARAIVEWREKNGAFSSLDDLARVKGVGERTLHINRANIRFAEPKT